MTCCSCLPHIGGYGGALTPLVGVFDAPSTTIATVRGGEGQSYSVNGGARMPLIGGKADIPLPAGVSRVSIYGGNLGSTVVAGPDLVEVTRWGDYILRGVAFYKPSVPGDTGIVRSPRLVAVPDHAPPPLTPRHSRICSVTAGSSTKRLMGGTRLI